MLGWSGRMGQGTHAVDWGRAGGLVVVAPGQLLLLASVDLGVLKKKQEGLCAGVERTDWAGDARGGQAPEGARGVRRRRQTRAP